MALNLGSPGVSIKEIDLTQGGIQGVLDVTGAIAGPFEKGPVNEPTSIANEQELLEIFGKPSKENNQFEYFLSASQYLSYGGNLQVVRSSGGQLSNSNSPVGSAVTTLLIENYDDFIDNHADDTSWYYAARTPGAHGNGIKVCTIDAFADQIIGGITTTGVVVGTGVTQVTTAQYPTTDGTVGTLDGYMKGIVTEIGPKAGEITVKFVSHVSAAGTEYKLEYTEAGPYEFKNSSTLFIDGAAVGTATTTISASTRGYVGTTAASHIDGTDVRLYEKVGATTIDQAGGQSVGTAVTGFHVASTTGILTTSHYLLINDELFDPIEIYSSSNFVAIGTDTSAAAGNRGKVGTTTATHNDGSVVTILTYNTATGVGTTAGTLNGAINSSVTSIDVNISADSLAIGDVIQLDDEFINITGDINEVSSLTPTSVRNWYDEQTLGLTNSTVYWKSLAPKPKTSEFCESRNTRNDEIHVVVVDDDGKTSGTAGSILEKHIALSKALNATTSSNFRTYIKDYLQNGSEYVYGGAAETGTPTGFTAGAASLTKLGSGSGASGQNAEDVIAFNASGRKVYTLGSGFSYSGTTTNPTYDVTLANVVSGYSKFSDERIPIDFLIMGPSMSTNRQESQAKANKLIAIANQRKDCIACISPHRGDVVGNAQGSTNITDKILEYYEGVTHSSYAVFDSGYKYTFDRFTNSFVYLPTSGDIAGTMARTNALNFPWYSPAGSSRGALNNVIKLAYNPTQLERDRLYGAGINPIITTRGQGTILFGDKTSLGKETSAFSRINVRRLFLFVEEAISRFSRGSIFEFNDSVTRANFVNTVDPFLRDIQSKRGITNFRVICDETNNSPDVIDRNEFRADIFIQPARSINYISLTFVATATGASFIESVGG